MSASIRALARVLLALGLVGCEGIGLPVVGERPLGPSMPDDACFAVSCEGALAPHAPRWMPTAELGVASSPCPARRSETLSLHARPETLDLRCTDATLHVEQPFTLDLRGVRLTGARLDVSSTVPGTVLLAGEIDAAELHVHGPIEVRMEGGAIGASRLVLDVDDGGRPPRLELDAVVVTDSVLAAAEASFLAHGSVLSRAHVSAEELTLEVSSCTDGTLRADRLSLLDATVMHSDLDVEVLVAAAGELDGVDVTRCTSVTLAVLDVLHTRIAGCLEPLELVDVDVDGCRLEGDVRGRARIRRSALEGERVVLEDSRLTLTALCGVASLDVSTTSVECPSCEPTAPAEICGASARVEPYCPGYESAPCQGQPRPRATDPLVAP
jgi:hypothetical protein